MESRPLVSVCIPAFNAESNIHRCIESVLAQDLSNAEILLVDNCSEDHTFEIAKNCLRHTKRVRIIQNDRNLGRVANWNRCLELASGQFVKFVLTNDLLMPGALTALLDAVRQGDDVVMAASASKDVTVLPSPLPPVSSNAKTIRRTGAETLTFFAQHGFLTGSLNGMIYRLDAIRNNNIYFHEGVPYFADFYHAIQLAEFGGAVFLDTETFCFDATAKGRYHFVGMKDPKVFFFEHRTCTDKLAETMNRIGRDGAVAYDYLLGRYYWYLGQGTPLRPRDAWRVFAGWPKMQLTAAAKTFWFNLRN